MPTPQSILRAINVLGVRAVVDLRQAQRINRGTIRGYYATHALNTLFEIGLFDELEQQSGVDLIEFATRKNLDHRILDTICAYLYELRVLKRHGNEYSLDADGKVIAHTMKGPFGLIRAYGDVFEALTPLARQEKTYGIDVHRRPELVATGSGAVGRLLAFPAMAAEISQRNKRRVLDLGCGDANFLIDLCSNRSDIIAFGMDIEPEAIMIGQKRVQEAGLANRVHLFIGDIFQVQGLATQFQEVEVATFVYVLHEFQDRIVTVLQRLREALPGVSLLVCEVIRHSPEELRRKPGGVSEIQFFHELSDQRLFSRPEWHDLFARAGYANVEENYLDFARTCIFSVS